MKRRLNRKGKRYIFGFIIIIALVVSARVVFSLSARKGGRQAEERADDRGENDAARILSQSTPSMLSLSRFYNADGTPKKHRVRGVRSYAESFPDSQSLQLQAAVKYGVHAVACRTDAERRKSELVYIGSNPFYDMKRLNSSVPYLVPRAAILLQDIARNFMDSLQVKGVPLNKLLISSVLRTKEDVERLRRHNHNATENSCHLYGTTFDIAYNKYNAITRPVRNDTLKWILSEVLDELRRQGRCYIKHENHQGCFHITVR